MKTPTHRRLLALGGATASAALILSGCSTAGNESSDSLEGYEMSILMEQVPETDYILELLPEFEDETGMTVNVEVVNFNSMYDQLVTQLSGPEGGGTFDVIQATNSWSDEFAKNGWMLDLGDRIADSDEIDESNYVPAIWQGLNTTDQTAFVPFYHWSMGWIYRTDLMSDEALAAEYEETYGRPLEVPTSVDELLEWQSFMTREYEGVEVSGNVIQGSSPQNIPEFLPYYFSYGCEWDDGETVLVDSECGVAALEAYREAFSNAPAGAEGMQFDQTSQVMTQGGAASMIGYLWMKGAIEGEGSAVAGDVEIANMPGGTGFLGAWGWGIPASAPNPEAGWAFIEWVESLDVASARAEMGGEPTRYDVYGNEELAAANPQWDVHLEILENAETWPEGLRTEAGQDEVGRVLALLVAGSISAEEAAEQIAADQQERMES